LTARHLLELFAIGEQANAYLRTGADLAEIVKLLQGSEYEYAIALLAWRSVFPETDWPDVDSQPKRVDDLIFDWYRLFPFELFVAADLALWPPYEPNGDLTLDRELRWSDIHPGRRFARILASYHDLGISPQVIPAENRNELFLEIQSKVCGHIGWPTPDALAGRWLNHLKVLHDAKETPWKNLEGHVSFRVPNAIKLLEARLHRPADVVLNNLSFPSLGIEGIPGWLFAEANGNRTVVSMSKDGDQSLVPLMVYEGVRHLMQPSRPVFRKNFDPNFRTQAILVLASQLRSACEWNDELTRRFLEEAKTYFRIA
jgi:hypothetical protein